MSENAVVGCGVALVVTVLLSCIVGAMFLFPAYSRYQNVLNAENKVKVTEIEIQNTEQQIQVEQKKAEVRVEEAKGIAKSQEIINASLTDKYLQHEAIKAQERMANSPNHTQIYIPSGYNGIPLVKTIEQENGEKSK